MVYFFSYGGDVSAVRVRCVRFPRVPTIFSFPLCFFLHLATISPPPPLFCGEHVCCAPPPLQGRAAGIGRRRTGTLRYRCSDLRA